MKKSALCNPGSLAHLIERGGGEAVLTDQLQARFEQSVTRAVRRGTEGTIRDHSADIPTGWYVCNHDCAVNVKFGSIGYFTSRWWTLDR